MKLLTVIYLAAFIAANLVVKHFGASGLWISSFLLIPFDYVCRCVFHEKWEGKSLIIRLSVLVVLSSICTVLINQGAINIAEASVGGFTAAQIGAGIFYQKNKSKSWFFKVNISDLIAIVFDSLVFQFIAFHNINPFITIGQIVIKFIGGLLWYYILFKKLKIYEKINRS